MRKFWAVVLLMVILLVVPTMGAVADGPTTWADERTTAEIVTDVDARVAELCAESAVRYAARRAASEARIMAILARIEAERAGWYTGPVATPTPVVVPRYVMSPMLISPNPDTVYGDRIRITTQVRSRTRCDEGEYKWWGEHIDVSTGGEVFQWTWDGILKLDEYFQVQLICPNGSHRGIHPPTKDYFTVQGGGLRYIVQDCKGAQTRAWDHESWSPVRNIPIEWTVAVVQWDGVDPSRIGVTLVEAEARRLRI